MPTTPHSAAGCLILQPVSVPKPARHKSHATAAATPQDDHQDTLRISWG